MKMVDLRPECPERKLIVFTRVGSFLSDLVSIRMVNGGISGEYFGAYVGAKIRVLPYQSAINFS